MSWSTLLDRRGFVRIVVVVWALVYLPHLGTRTMRLEEGRRSLIAREMLDSGDFIRPTIYRETYLYKPPLFNWMIAVGGWAMGDVSPLASRIPSVLGALGCALVALVFAPQSLDRRTRSLAALFVLSSSTLLDKGTLGEIDASLCLMVALAFKFWWDGNRPDRQTMGSWVLAGLLLGLSGLHKGPTGPSIFYLTIVPYMVWAGRLRRLVSVGHLVCLLLMAAPSLAWTAALVQRGVVPVSDLIMIWGGQLGARDAAATISEPGTRVTRLLNHYAEFGPLVLGMFFPGVLWLIFGFRRRWCAERDVPEDLRKFLVCGVFWPFLAYFLYPESRARHLMPAFFAAAVLAAVVVMAIARRPGPWGPRGHRSGLMLSWAPLVVTALGVILAAVEYPVGLPAALAGLVVGFVWAFLSARVTRATPPEAGPITLAVTIINIPLVVWFVANLVVVPWRAPMMTTHHAKELSAKVPQDETIYTTRTFPGKGEGFYNIHFHLARNYRAAKDLDVLRQAAPCIAVITPFEREELEATGMEIEEIGRAGSTTNRAMEVHVVRLKRRPDK
jgi:4-amino-4-deoxy-L-arabinose transferase-like glycosyltransferase